MDQFFNLKKLLRNRVSILYHESNINDANAKIDPIYNLLNNPINGPITAATKKEKLDNRNLL